MFMYVCFSKIIKKKLDWFLCKIKFLIFSSLKEVLDFLVIDIVE